MQETINAVSLTGSVRKTPERTMVGDEPTVVLSMAVDDTPAPNGGQSQALVISVAGKGAVALSLNPATNIGSRIFVCGGLAVNTWTDNATGKLQRKLVIEAAQIVMLSASAERPAPAVTMAPVASIPAWSAGAGPVLPAAQVYPPPSLPAAPVVVTAMPPMPTPLPPLRAPAPVAASAPGECGGIPLPPLPAAPPVKVTPNAGLPVMPPMPAPPMPTPVPVAAMRNPPPTYMQLPPSPPAMVSATQVAFGAAQVPAGYPPPPAMPPPQLPPVAAPGQYGGIPLPSIAPAQRQRQ